MAKHGTASRASNSAPRQVPPSSQRRGRAGSVVVQSVQFAEFAEGFQERLRRRHHAEHSEVVGRHGRAAGLQRLEVLRPWRREVVPRTAEGPPLQARTPGPKRRDLGVFPFPLSQEEQGRGHHEARPRPSLEGQSGWFPGTLGFAVRSSPSSPC